LRQIGFLGCTVAEIFRHHAHYARGKIRALAGAQPGKWKYPITIAGTPGTCELRRKQNVKHSAEIMSKIMLSSGYGMPVIGLGTWKVSYHVLQPLLKQLLATTPTQGLLKHVFE